jgi:uncharacterized protein (DUF2236 family)
MDGYFSSDSLIRQVHNERAVGLFYGARALCIGATNPLTYVATALHSPNLQAPFGRLARTAEVIEAIIFSSRREADRLLARTRRMHAGIAGVLPVDAGPYPAGTPYAALDPELMLWTIAVMADSARRFYELFVQPLTYGDKEAFWYDYRRLGELFGLSEAALTTSYPQFVNWWCFQLDKELSLTPEARQAGYAAAFQVPIPAYAFPLRRLYRNILLGSLPSQVRELYGLSYTTGDNARFRKSVKTVQRSSKYMPRWLTRGRSAHFFQWVAKTERWRIEHGIPTPYFTSPTSGQSPSHLH